MPLISQTCSETLAGATIEVIARFHGTAQDVVHHLGLPEQALLLEFLDARRQQVPPGGRDFEGRFAAVLLAYGVGVVVIQRVRVVRGGSQNQAQIALEADFCSRATARGARAAFFMVTVIWTILPSTLLTFSRTPGMK